MRTVVILGNVNRVRNFNEGSHLIRHDHNVTVPQAIDRGVILVVLETQYLLDMLDFDILDDLIVTCFSNIEQLSAKREDTIVVTANDAQTGYGKSLGGISFSENQGAAFRVSASSVVGVFQFDDTRDTVSPSVSPT